MGSTHKKFEHKRSKQGIFQHFKLNMTPHKIGELLMRKGRISQEDLHRALESQQEQYRPLGKILVDHKMISPVDLLGVICRQQSLRAVTAVMLFTFSIGGIVFQKKAKADYMKDLRPEIALSAHQNFNRVAAFPRFLGTAEKKSYNLKPFTKWTSMFDRFDRAMDRAEGKVAMEQMKKRLVRYKNLPLHEMADKVNRYMNEVTYVTDSKNWGKSDYWATPVEFMRRGGDCEDFAIAKYTALRALGVPEERLRIAIVHDNLKNIPHAILVVYTDQGSYILDNQNKRMVSAENYNRYRPIFTINRTAWWLHTAQGGTRLASAN